MAEIDTQLATALKQAKGKSMCFALVAKGLADGKLIVSKTKVPAKQVADAKAKLGGGTLWRGRCLGDEGALVFEVPKAPPPTLAGQLKKVISRDAGLTLKVDVRIGQGLEEDDDGTPPAASATPAPSAAPAAAPAPATQGDLVARYKQRLAAILPVYQQVVKASPERRAALDQLKAAVAAAAQANRFDQGLAALDQLETALREKPPQPAAAAAPAAADTMATFKERVKTVKSQVDALKDRDAKTHAALCQRLAGALGKAQARDFNSAFAALEAIATDPKAAGSAAAQVAAPSAQPATDEAARFTARLKALLPNVLKAQAGPTPLGQDAKLRVSEAQMFAKKKDFAQANAILDQLDQLTKQALAAAASPAPSHAGPEVNVPTKTLEIWQQAKEAVGSQILNLQAALRQTKEPKFLRIADLGMNGITKRLQVGLHVALMEFDQASGAARAKARGKAEALVADFQKFLQSNPEVQLVDENPFGVAVTIRESLGKALDGIAKSLAA
jgi:hypothetical protein